MTSVKKLNFMKHATLREFNTRSEHETECFSPYSKRTYLNLMNIL